LRYLFETSRLTIRPRRLSDTEACLAMDREPGVTRFIDGSWGDPVAHRAFIEARTCGEYPEGLGYWALCPRDDPDVFLGWVLLIPEDTVVPETEIGWRLRRSAWGQGLATEAARPLIQHAFDVLNLPRVVAYIDPGNAGSRRVAEKLGLRPAEPAPPIGSRYLRYVLSWDSFAAGHAAP
jgi:RimJ/RimL family protein N-acetyltransferase